MKRNSKGFTLMEMLIVIAIIAILVAIAIPTFSGALTKAKEAADEANIRSYYGKIVIENLTDNTEFSDTYEGSPLNYTDKLEWTYEDGILTITYNATKIDVLSLTAEDGTAIEADDD